MSRIQRALRPFVARRVGAAALFLAALAACTDRLTAPQAEQLVLATEAIASGESSDAADRLWAAMGLPVHWPGALPRVVLHDGSRRREFVALVLERVMVPEFGLAVNHCSGTRRVLLLQSPGAVAERVVLHGVDFGLAISADRDELCAGDGTPYRAPRVFLQRGEHDLWLGTGGRASISPGTALGPCTMLSADAERWMREQLGMTCEFTTHHVDLRALLKPSLLPDGVPRLGSSTRRVAIPTVEVRGVRVTIDCVGTPRAAFLCGGPPG